jgi:hypothetical protein
LFTSFVSPDPNMVANHTVFCYVWLHHIPYYVGENFGIIFKFLKKNTDDRLWSECLTEYEKSP